MGYTPKNPDLYREFTPGLANLYRDWFDIGYYDIIIIMVFEFYSEIVRTTWKIILWLLSD